MHLVLTEEAYFEISLTYLYFLNRVGRILGFFRLANVFLAHSYNFNVQICTSTPTSIILPRWITFAVLRGAMITSCLNRRNINLIIICTDGIDRAILFSFEAWRPSIPLHSKPGMASIGKGRVARLVTCYCWMNKLEKKFAFLFYFFPFILFSSSLFLSRSLIFLAAVSMHARETKLVFLSLNREKTSRKKKKKCSKMDRSQSDTGGPNGLHGRFVPTTDVHARHTAKAASNVLSLTLCVYLWLFSCLFHRGGGNQHK